jgi:hypothetical protein
MPKQRERCLNAVQKSKNYCGGNYLSVSYCYYLDKLTNRMSQLQVNQVKDKAKKKKEIKRSNHQAVIKNQQNYSNPYQATKLRPARDWEILNCIKLTQHYKTH